MSETLDDADKHLREPVGAVALLGDMYNEFGDAADDYYDTFEDGPSQRPTGIIIHYEVTLEAMDASFQYEKLPDSEEFTGREVFNHWWYRFLETGDYSA